MDPITLNSEAKNTGRNIENKNKIISNNSNEVSIYRPENANIPQKIPNKFISFITPKVGIIIISSSVIAIV